MPQSPVVTVSVRGSRSALLLDVRYGRGHVAVEVPDGRLVSVLRGAPPPPLEDPEAAVGRALESPIGCEGLSAMATGRRDAAVVVSDITRPAPNALMLPPIVEALRRGGIHDDRITVLIATGAHRRTSPPELRELLGTRLAATCRAVDHVATDGEAHTCLGTTPQGVPLHIDRRYVEADLKILTGLIEPHYMAGYSGGRKAVCPGLASVETIGQFHRHEILMDARSTTGVLAGNPVHEAALAAARAAGADFIVNAALDDQRRVTGVWAGELEAAHLAGCHEVGRGALAVCPEPVDVVVTSNAGYPLDCNVYQATKGMVGALAILKPGGTILIAAQCSEGLGSAAFASVLRAHSSIEEALVRLADPSRFAVDQWGVTMLAKAVTQARVLIHSEGLLESDARSAYLTPVPSLQAGLGQALALHGPDAKVAVIPDGPYTMATLAPDGS